MAKYTLELRQMLKDQNFSIFNFDYDFYTDDKEIRKKFEQKFTDRYMFNEICCETVGRWKHMLRTKLNEIAPYYKQLYESEMKAKNIEFLLNKDYTETFTKDTITDLVNENQNSATYSDNNKTSDIADGVSDVSLSQKNLTSVSSNSSTNSDIGTSNVNGNVSESYTLSGKGNIGTTSSAELLQKWREIMINIDQQILNELYELFMLIY